MVRDDAKSKTIFWLILLLCIVIWLELVMVVKFFTKEFLEYTIEEDSRARVYYQELILANESKKEEEPMKTAETDENVNSTNIVKDGNAEKQSNYFADEVPTQTVPEATAKPTLTTQTVSSRANIPSATRPVNIPEKNETIQNTNNIPDTYKGYATIRKD